MNAPTLFSTLRRLLKRASSLLMLFQRTPVAQLLLPAEFNLASSVALADSAKILIATVAGLGAFDSVAGATALSQLSPSSGSTIMPVTAGTPFTGVFRVTGSPSVPASWRIIGTLPEGLTFPKQAGATATLSGTTVDIGDKVVKVQAWEGSNYNGHAAQKDFTIRVSAPPPAAIAKQPVSVMINNGQSTTLTVVAMGQAPFNYQWYQGIGGDTSTPVGTDSASLTTPVLTATTLYWVKVTNAENPAGAVSEAVTVTVRQPAALIAQPAPVSVDAGDTATLTVEASGYAPITYQWYEGESGVTTTPVGTNSPTFTTPPLPLTTSYWVKVTNVANTGGTFSNTATVTVNQPSLPTLFTESPLPTGRTGLAYSTRLVGIGGTLPYSWALEGGALPAGLTLSSTGIISGTPTGTELSQFTIVLTDDEGLTASRLYLLRMSDLTVLTTTLPTAVNAVAYSTTLSGSGVNTPHAWTISSGSPPAGITLSSGGLLSGTPTTAGTSTFTVNLADSTGFSVSQTLSLVVSAIYLKPVIDPVHFPITTIGAQFSHTITAQNYPKTFTITGLPKGLKVVPATGVISGRPEVSGVFNVQIRAVNTAGASTLMTTPLIVKALDKNFIGSFGGLVARGTSNANLGGYISLTTTSIGGYTVKLVGALAGNKAVHASTPFSAIGRMSATAPQIVVPLGGQTLTLTLDALTGRMTGTLGTAAVNGWHAAWNAVANPAEAMQGYYTVALNLADPADSGVVTIPQGSGFAALTVGLGGTVMTTGKTADGETITSASFLGAEGDFWIYTPLNKNFGSVQGGLQLTRDAQDLFTGNVVQGELTWLRPATSTTLYPGGFGPLRLSAGGAYLAPVNKGFIILGLPAAGLVQLGFADGGLALSHTDPDLSFTYTDDEKILMPPASANPAGVTVSLNPGTGALAGTFTLLEVSPPLTRAKVPFTGLVVRSADGQLRAAGYFLLPQIPASGQKAADVQVLSGGVRLLEGTFTE
ncbi:MAG: putative Ig domain-containing protein [Verrucomicrobiota bacterium]